MAKVEKTTKTDEKPTDAKTSPKGIGQKKVCFFCENKKQPTYLDSATLKKFLSDRSRIIAAQKTGACAKHQRAITKEIKHARHLALLPFVTSI